MREYAAFMHVLREYLDVRLVLLEIVLQLLICAVQFSHHLHVKPMAPVDTLSSRGMPVTCALIAAAR